MPYSTFQSFSDSGSNKETASASFSAHAAHGTLLRAAADDFQMSSSHYRATIINIPRDGACAARSHQRNRLVNGRGRPMTGARLMFCNRSRNQSLLGRVIRPHPSSLLLLLLARHVRIWHSSDRSVREILLHPVPASQHGLHQRIPAGIPGSR